jgi:ketosteroid isomerase-like protein
MSRENVEVVRRTYEAFDRREMYLDSWDAEAEWRPAMAGAVEGKAYRGHSELRHYLDELFESFSEVRAEDREFRDLDDDRVLVLYRLRVMGRDSDVAVDQPGAALYEVRDGKIIRASSFLSQAEALEAAGLAE